MAHASARAVTAPPGYVVQFADYWVRAPQHEK